MTSLQQWMAGAGKTGCRLLVLASLTAVLSACGGGSGPAPAGTAATAATAADPGGARAQIRAGGGTAVAAVPDPGVDMQVVAVTQVSETRVGRTMFDYVLRVTVRNTSAFAYSNVVVTLTAAGPGTTLIDTSAALGALAAGAELAVADTVTVRQDRTQTFNVAALQWRIAGTAGSSPQAQLAALEDQGRIPKLERGPTLQGVDLNGNGVRDDIDAYIAAQYPQAPQRAAAVQTARALQVTLAVPAQDVAAAKVAALVVSRSVNCVFNQFSGGANSKEPALVVKELEAITTNTKPRLLAYLAYSKTLDGTSSALPEGDTCE